MKRTRTSLLIAAALLAASSINLFAAEGDLYVSNLATNTVDVYAPDGTKTVFAGGLSSPQGLVFDQAHNLFVADAVTGEIYKYDTTGNQTTFYSGLAGPVGLAIDHRGNLLVGESLNGGDGLLIPFDGSVPTVFAYGNPVFGVAAGPGKRFYTALTNLDWNNSDGSKVAMGFDADTQGVTAVLRSRSQDVTFFVSLNNGEIWFVQVNTLFRRLVASGLSHPNGMAFLAGHGSGGELFVADRGTGKIWKYDLDGTGSVFVTDAGTPNFLVFEE